MSIIGYIYIVSGTPFIKPHVTSSVSEAYHYVESIRPKKSKIKCSEKELNSIFVGNSEHLEILIDTKIDNKKILIYLFKTHFHSYPTRNEKNIQKTWKKKLKDKKDEKILLNLANESSDKAKYTKEKIKLKARESRDKGKRMSHYYQLMHQLSTDLNKPKNEIYWDLKWALQFPDEIKKDKKRRKQLRFIYEKIKHLSSKEMREFYLEVDRLDALDATARILRMRREGMKDFPSKSDKEKK